MFERRGTSFLPPGTDDVAMVTKKRVAPVNAASPVSEQAFSAPEVRVLRRFRLVFNAVKTHFQQVEKKAGVGGAQFWALSVIRAHPGLGACRAWGASAANRPQRSISHRLFAP